MCSFGNTHTFYRRGRGPHNAQSVGPLLGHPRNKHIHTAAGNVTVFYRRKKQATITRVAVSLIHVQPFSKNKKFSRFTNSVLLLNTDKYRDANSSLVSFYLTILIQMQFSKKAKDSIF